MNTILDSGLNTSQPNSEIPERFTPLLKRIEWVLIVLVLFALTMKFLHASFGGALAIISLSSLAFFYSFLGAYFGGGRWSTYRMIFESRIFIRRFELILPGLGLSMLCLGFLYKIMFWMGFQFMIQIGVFLTLVSVPVMFYSFKKKQVEIYKQFMNRCIIYGALGFLFYITPATTLIDILHPANDPEKAAFKNFLEHPDDPKAQKEWEHVQHRLDSIRNSH